MIYHEKEYEAAAAAYIKQKGPIPQQIKLQIGWLVEVFSRVIIHSSLVPICVCVRNYTLCSENWHILSSTTYY